MPMMPGKIALLELLKQEGVRVMFGNPGTTELPLMDAFAGERDIRYVLALQEAPAMGMADGYAQASGQLACVNLHAAPGLGNAIMETFGLPPSKRVGELRQLCQDACEREFADANWPFNRNRARRLKPGRGWRRGDWDRRHGRKL